MQLTELVEESLHPHPVVRINLACDPIERRCSCKKLFEFLSPIHPLVARDVAASGLHPVWLTRS
jgi:hypothetical protein